MAATSTAAALISPDSNAGLDAGLWGKGNMEVYAGSITLAAEAKASTVEMTTLPIGFTPFFGVMMSAVTFGAASIGVGLEATAEKYRLYGTFSIINLPHLFMIPAVSGVVLTVAEPIWVTENNVAALPTGLFILGMVGSRHAV